jgi:two-component system nitrate/nitrite response regulator NarL
VLIVEGLSNKLLADRLGISHHTAKFHVFNTIKKLGKTTRSGAAAEAIRRGIVP